MRKTKVMGILNVTPDSFFAGSRVSSAEKAIEVAIKLVAQGADIIDIGGESTRPGSLTVDIEEEIERVIPVFKGLKDVLNVPLSIDSKKKEVVELAVANGASIINDISGFQDPEMRAIAADSNCDCVVTHMKGIPETMQKDPFYEGGVVQEVFDFLDKQTQLLIHDGVDPDRVVIDPGIGFGKTMEDNFELIYNIQIFKKLGFRVLYGISRKSFLRSFLNKGIEEMCVPTLAINSFLILKSCDIIRVHDVKEHRDEVDLLSYLTSRS